MAHMNVYLVLQWLFIENVLDTYTSLRNQNNIFWLDFLDVVLNYYK